MRCWPLILALFIAHPAIAGALSDAQVAYRDGRWREAEAKAEQAGSADGFALSARTILTQAMIEGTMRVPLSRIAEAKNLADRALKQNPRHIEGRLQLATALGMEARLIPPISAVAQGLPQRSRRLLISVTRDAPESAWAWALIGGWHIEALRQGGAAAEAALGANFNQGKAAFAKALALDPAEPAIPFYYAACLLNLKQDAAVPEVRALLKRAASASRRGAFQDAVRQRALEVARTLDREGTTKAAALAAQFM
jgi:tetratricopeptide (TPR) repeat protein